MSFFLTFGTTPTKATDSVSGYISRYTLTTSDMVGWSGAENTNISDSSVERNGKYVVSFSAPSSVDYLESSFSVGSMPTTNYDITSLTFKFLLYIDDINAIKDRSGNFLGGEIGFYGKKIYSVETEPVEGDTPSVTYIEEPVYYTWDLSSINLKKGWNRLTLNFKTENTDNVFSEYTFEGITEFRLKMNKNKAAKLEVAMDNAEISVLSIAEDGKVIETITDTHSVTELAVAAGIAAVVVGGVTAAGYLWAKKEEKRRRRERRARARARREREQQD